MHHNNLHKSILIKIINIKINQLAGRCRQKYLGVNTINIRRCRYERCTEREVEQGWSIVAMNHRVEVMVRYRGLVLENSDAESIMQSSSETDDSQIRVKSARFGVLLSPARFFRQ